MIFPKRDFPIFSVHPKLSYLDSAATTQKPLIVIDTISDFYKDHNAQVYRGIYELAEWATERYEKARNSVANYCGVQDEEIIFTKGATESINLVTFSWASQHVNPGDEIIISELEHHANILPWMRLEKTHGIVLKYIPLSNEGDLNYSAYLSMLTPKTKLVAITHTSNVLGTRVDLPLIISRAKDYGAKVLVDATQAAGREQLKLNELSADFVAFSGHKMLGPTGIGILYMSRAIQQKVVPYQLGGGMVHSVGFHEYESAEPPLKYEAGTPPIAQAIGLDAAIQYLSKGSFEDLKAHEAQLCKRLIEGIELLPSFRLLGPLDQLKESGHLVSFVSEKAHAHDIAAFVDRSNICVRAGHHCAQPLHSALGIDASVRASFYGYTQLEDVDRLVEALKNFEKSF